VVAVPTFGGAEDAGHDVVEEAAATQSVAANPDVVALHGNVVEVEEAALLTVTGLAVGLVLLRGRALGVVVIVAATVTVAVTVTVATLGEAKDAGDDVVQEHTGAQQVAEHVQVVALKGDVVEVDQTGLGGVAGLVGRLVFLRRRTTVSAFRIVVPVPLGEGRGAESGQTETQAQREGRELAGLIHTFSLLVAHGRIAWIRCLNSTRFVRILHPLSLKLGSGTRVAHFAREFVPARAVCPICQHWQGMRLAGRFRAIRPGRLVPWCTAMSESAGIHRNATE
jgi:hypothetical protein